jgi:hypothetical protein
MNPADVDSKSTAFDIPAQSKLKQRLILLAALRIGPVSTLHAREVLGVQHPAGRVHELRQQGNSISTVKAWQQDQEGRRHLVASYVLNGGCHHE